MAIRLQEMHPALVHLPIALLPLAVGADVVGRMTDNEGLLSFGRKAIGVAAVGAVGSAVTGLIAGEEVNVEGASQDMLITHRNLNFVATVVARSMTLWRVKHRKPNAAYLGAGAVGVGVLAYTAYLGASLPRGVYRSDAPALKSGQIGSFVKTRGRILCAACNIWSKRWRKADLSRRLWPRSASSRRLRSKPKPKRRRERINGPLQRFNGSQGLRLLSFLQDIFSCRMKTQTY